MQTSGQMKQTTALLRNTAFQFLFSCGFVWGDSTRVRADKKRQQYPRQEREGGSYTCEALKIKA